MREHNDNQILSANRVVIPEPTFKMPPVEDKKLYDQALVLAKSHPTEVIIYPLISYVPRRCLKS